jgi:hypothetical protein
MATTRSFIHVPINVVHLFEITKNCSFGFLYHLRELLVLWKKNVRVKELPALVISNPLKEPTILMKEPAMNWHFYGQLPDFSSFFRIMVMNPKNHVDNHQGSVPLSQHLLQFLSKQVFLLARTLEKHIFFWEKVANTF